MDVLDLGCGEGKNAAALARAGAKVTAIDCSDIAIENGRRGFSDLPISWHVGDAIHLLGSQSSYDLIIMYGLAHCLPTPAHISKLIEDAIAATRRGGTHLFVAFND